LGVADLFVEKRGEGNSLLERIDFRRMVLQKLIYVYGLSIWWLKRRSCLVALEKARTTGMETVRRLARKLEFPVNQCR
jgi:hypothetical protein